MRSNFWHNFINVSSVVTKKGKELYPDKRLKNVTNFQVVNGGKNYFQY